MKVLLQASGSRIWPSFGIFHQYIEDQEGNLFDKELLQFHTQLSHFYFQSNFIRQM